jgi:2-dehydropantoate 2-reductase
MRIVIMGTGAVGGVFAAHLIDNGAEVHVIARGANLDAFRAHGLRIVGPAGAMTARPASATDDPATIGPADLILFCTKTYGTTVAARALAPVLRAGTLVASLQNGPDRGRAIGALVAPADAVDGLCFVSGFIAEPGVIHRTSAMSSIVIGQPADAGARAVAERFAATHHGRGIDISVDPQIERAVWTKLILLSTNFLLTSLARAPAGIVYHRPDLEAVARAAMTEVVTVARAAGVDLPVSLIDEQLARIKGFPPDMYASMYYDLAAGRPLELMDVCGAILALADRHGIDAPVHRIGVACLAPHVHGARP